MANEQWQVIKKHRGMIFGVVIALTLFLVQLFPVYKDSIVIQTGRLHHDSKTDDYEIKESAEPLQGVISFNLVVYSLSVLSLIISILAGWIFDSVGDMVNKEELKELHEDIKLTKETVKSSLERALGLPPENKVNPAAFSQITEIICDEVIKKIVEQFCDKKNSEVLEFDVVLQTLQKMLSNFGNGIKNSDSSSGLPVENLSWSKDARQIDGTPSFKRDYPEFVTGIIKDHAIEFRGVSLMPPCMWTAPNDKFGLRALIDKQTERINFLKVQGTESPLFERILLCPSDLVGKGEEHMLAAMRKKHKKSGIKLKIIGMEEKSDFDYYKSYKSDDYCDYVLVKCKSSKGNERWFVITSLGFNKLTIQEDLIKGAKAQGSTVSPQQYLAKLFAEVYPDFVEGRLIYDKTTVDMYIEMWNQIVRVFEEEDEDAGITFIDV